jgi:hypothetical protein
MITDAAIASRIHSRYRARFQPQAWIRDYAVDIDPEGETQWDVTPEHLARLVGVAMRHRFYPLSFEDALREATETSTDLSDELREDPAAPAWVRAHRGPFYCEAWPINISD